MTIHLDDEHLDDEHLDDEQLSAYLDGQEPGAARHLGTCARCDERLAALRDAAAAIAGRVPGPPAGAEERAVAGALAGAPPASVVHLRRRRPAPWVAAAAAIAALVVGAGAVRLLRGGPSTTTQAARSGRASSALAAGTVLDGGDLGELSDARVLAERLRTGLAEAPVAAQPTAGKTSVPGPAQSTDQQASRASPGAAATVSGSRPPCAAEAQRTYGPPGPLVYTASLRWEGTPAVALVYRAPAEGTRPARSQVLVMARADCRLLVAQLI